MPGKKATATQHGMIEMTDLTKMTREQLIIMVMNLQDENERLRKANVDMGWQLNPDRMGGQFTREETERNWDGGR